MDIRSHPRSKWYRLLSQRWPRPMDEGLGWTPQEGSAIICVIIVMKMLILFTDKSLDSGGSELKSVQAQTEAERRNVLLRYAWHDTSAGADAAAVLRLQEEVYKELMEPEGQWVQAVSGGVTFEGLMESRPMLKYFWSRPEFRLYVGFEVEKNKNNSRVPFQRILQADGTGMLTTELAQESLVRWTPSGAPLEQLLDGSFKSEDEQGRSFYWVEGWSIDELECVRVLYNPEAAAHPTGYKDLAAITVRPISLRRNKHGAKWGSRREIEYRLVAVVRLGPLPYVRIYDMATQYCVPRALSTQAVACLNSDWELGQLGSKYMLYYVRALPTDPEAESGPEMSPTRPDHEFSRIINLQQPSFRRNAHSPPPPTAPTEPRAHRELAASTADPLRPSPMFSSGANSTPIPKGKARGFVDEVSAEPSGQHGGPAAGLRDAGVPATRNSATETTGPDVRSRPDEINLPHHFSREPRNLAPRKKRPRPAEEARASSQSLAWPHPQNAGGQSEANVGPERAQPQGDDEPGVRDRTDQVQGFDVKEHLMQRLMRKKKRKPDW